MNGIYLYFVNKHLSSWELLGLQATADSDKQSLEELINQMKSL